MLTVQPGCARPRRELAPRKVTPANALDSLFGAALVEDVAHVTRQRNDTAEHLGRDRIMEAAAAGEIQTRSVLPGCPHRIRTLAWIRFAAIDRASQSSGGVCK